MLLTILANTNGESVWLAGAAGIQDGLSSIAINLSINTGREFLSDDLTQMTDRDIVGTARITTISCNQIELDLDLIEPFGSQQLTLNRVLDQTFNDFCSDE